MDQKSIGLLKKKMKFFKPIPRPNSLFQSWAYLDDVQDIPVPFCQICFLYSTHHNQLPKNGDPNTAFSIGGTQSEESEMSSPSISLLKYLYSMTVDIQCEYVHDPCLQLLSISQHSHYYIFELSNHVSFVEHLPLKHDNDILSPILYEPLTDLHYGWSVYNLPYCKSINFIETESTCNEIAGF